MAMPQAGRMILAPVDTGKHVDTGTVPHHIKTRRRAANKAARAARRHNRKG